MITVYKRKAETLEYRVEVNGAGEIIYGPRDLGRRFPDFPTGWRLAAQRPETRDEAIAVMRAIDPRTVEHTNRTLVAAMCILRAGWFNGWFYMISASRKSVHMWDARNAPGWAFQGRHARFAPPKPADWCGRE